MPFVVAFHCHSSLTAKGAAKAGHTHASISACPHFLMVCTTAQCQRGQWHPKPWGLLCLIHTPCCSAHCSRPNLDFTHPSFFSTLTPPSFPHPLFHLTIAARLYEATGDAGYLREAESHYERSRTTERFTNPNPDRFSYENVLPALHLMLYKVRFRGEGECCTGSQARPH